MRIEPKLLLVWILGFVMVLSYAITDDFVRVTQFCPDGPSAFGEIIILSDQDAVYPYALCRGREYSFVQISVGVYRLRFRHSGDPNEDCLSTLVFQENYYAVQVNIPIQDNLVTSKIETKIVKCPIAFHAPSKMTISNRDDLIFKNKESTPVEKPSNLADLKLHSDTMIKPEEPETILMSLQVQEIDNSTNFANVQIYSLMKNPRLEINGVSPIECHMSANSEVQFIIDNGCGTGSLLPLHTGFEVQGIVSWSPVFSFPVPHDGSLFVNCTFGVCKNKCNGSSCHQSNIDILAKYTASAAVSFTSLHEDVRQHMADSKDAGLQVTNGYPPIQNNPVDNVTTGTPASYTITVNVPLIIALSVLIPIVSILLIAVCWYRSKANSGAYRVRDRANP